MVDITSNINKYDVQQFDRVRKVWVETPTSDSTDTFDVDLTDYGATTVRGILGFVETTDGSVVAQEQPTTSVSGNTLTVTIGGSGVTNKKRNYEILIR